MQSLTGAFRIAARSSASSSARLTVRPVGASVSGLRQYSSGGHEEESYDAFNKRYASFFSTVQDLFELQRGLNNCFAYDLVPSQEVVEEALKASRRVNDYSTAVRIFEGLKEKVENKQQYKAYLDETAALRKELGIQTKEELYGQA